MTHLPDHILFSYVPLFLLGLAALISGGFYLNAQKEARQRSKRLALLNPTDPRSTSDVKLPQELVALSHKLRKPDYTRPCLIVGGLLGCGLIMYGDTADIYQFTGVGLFGICSAIHLISLALRARRQKAFSDFFPLALDILIRGVHAGQGLSHTFREIADMAPSGPDQLFKSLSAEISIGRDVGEAFAKFVPNLPFGGVRALAVILAIQRKSGGQYAAVLEELRDALLMRRQQEKLIKSLTSEGRAAAAVVVSLAILTFVGMGFLHPDHMTFLISDPSGQGILMYSVSSVMAGIACIYVLVEIGS